MTETPTIADLIHYPDTRPGIARFRCGRGFTYVAADGTRIDRGPERQRLQQMAVPPAYSDVWMSPLANGHLQATGRDARARKQYRYHPDWQSYRARDKYGHLAEFGRALPGLRRRIRGDLSDDEPDRRFAIAAVLALIDRLSLRIGNEAYALENGSYGATTLKPRHLRLEDGGLVLKYPGKGGRIVTRQIRDATLQRVLHRLDDLPGATLVGWSDESGAPHSVTSDQINARLHEITGNPAITAKTFRTWNGSVAALSHALRADRVTIRGMAEAAAERLANTPAIARSSYIHPAVIALAEDAAPLSRAPAAHDGLRRDETRLLDLIER